MLAKRRQCSKEEIKSKSEAIKFKVLNLIDEKINKIGIYVSFDNEVDTFCLINDLLQQKKIIYCPKIIGNKMEFFSIKNICDLDQGKYGILEPSSDNEKPNSLDLLIVPLIAFNQDKYRIGYGKGFYDKYLENHHCKTIGLAFDFQKVDNKFEEIFDQKLDLIITDKEII